MLADQLTSSSHAHLTANEFFSVFAGSGSRFSDMAHAAVGCGRTAKLQNRAVSPSKPISSDVLHESHGSKCNCAHDVTESSKPKNAPVTKPASVATSLIKSASAWSSQNEVIKQPPGSTSPREKRKSNVLSWILEILIHVNIMFVLLKVKLASKSWISHFRHHHLQQPPQAQQPQQQPRHQQL